MKTIKLIILLFLLNFNLAFNQDKEDNWLNGWQRPVVALGSKFTTNVNYNGKIIRKDIFNLVGTGVVFYVKYDTITLPCLITAKHVFYNSQENWKPNNLFIRFSWFDDLSIFDYLGTEILLNKNNKPTWFAHPDSTVDLAGLIFNPSDKDLRNEELSQLGYRLFADSSDYFTGNKVYVFGYPGAVGTEYWTKPLLREGIISWTNSKSPHKSQFLIDCDIFPGNSGGPVFSIPIGINRKGEIMLGGKITFIGIVSQRRLNVNTVKDSNGMEILLDNKGNKLMSFESIGIGVIEPATRVNELLHYIENKIKN
jgi:hypothetical protein